MAKEAYYFSHDSNARHDPKITAMRGVYGSEGYGWWWMLVEMMREADEYKLDIKSKYAFNAYAMQLQCECNAIASFVHDCINEFNLFSSDGEHFWSDSLLRRMEIRDEKSKKARESANARWKKQQKNANASNDDANESKNDALKESKRKETKVKEIKEHNENTVALTNHLIDLLKINNPNVKIPQSLDKWNDEMDKLERIDNYDFMQIRSVIDYCQNDSFWKSNILSVPKLREKIGTLMMQMQRPKGNQNSQGSNGKVSAFERLQQLAKEEEQREASGHY